MPPTVSANHRISLLPSSTYVLSAQKKNALPSMIVSVTVALRSSAPLKRVFDVMVMKPNARTSHPQSTRPCPSLVHLSEVVSLSLSQTHSARTCLLNTTFLSNTHPSDSFNSPSLCLNTAITSSASTADHRTGRISWPIFSLLNSFLPF